MNASLKLVLMLLSICWEDDSSTTFYPPDSDLIVVERSLYVYAITWHVVVYRKDADISLTEENPFVCTFNVDGLDISYHSQSLYIGMEEKIFKNYQSK